jgi:CRISPR-associated protein Cas2
MRMTKRRLYLVAYDITEPDRRVRALKVCKAHGLGGQKSAHECILSNRERRELEAALDRIIDAKSDRVFMLRLDADAEIRGLGQAKRPPEPLWFYIG